MDTKAANTGWSFILALFSVFIQTLRKSLFSNIHVKCASRITIMQLHVALAYTSHKTACLVHRFKQVLDAELTFSFYFDLRLIKVNLISSAGTRVGPVFCDRTLSLKSKENARKSDSFFISFFIIIPSS